MTNGTLLVIEPNGDMRFIYDDGLAELLDAGEVVIERASHVEPAVSGGWEAEMIHSGEVLGPFDLRSQALAAEVVDLEEFLIH